MSRIRNLDWQEDEELREDLQRYVLQNLQRKEVLDFVERDYPQYAWSLPTLSRRKKEGVQLGRLLHSEFKIRWLIKSWTKYSWNVLCTLCIFLTIICILGLKPYALW